MFTEHFTLQSPACRIIWLASINPEPEWIKTHYLLFSLGYYNPKLITVGLISVYVTHTNVTHKAPQKTQTFGIIS